MCDDAAALVASMLSRGVVCDGPSDERWGRVVHVTLPSGARLGVYQPKHPTALSLARPS